jgi:hypothetical protein
MCYIQLKEEEKGNNRIIYVELALSQIPRLLSLMDRKKGSKTYGCGDRYYWRYKMIDFSSAVFQNTALVLAQIYTKKYPNNVYYNHPKIRDWAIAAMEFLTKIQNDDGSFDYGWSVAAAAFPTYAVSEAYLLLHHELNDSFRERIIETLEKAGNWLLKSQDIDVTNQEAGALIALYNLYQITGDDKYRNGAENKMKLILKNQSPEGWFNEYGGGDIAYLTVTIDSLAKYYQKTGNKDILKILDEAIEFICYFVHPNGTMGGEYASRNPEFIIPSGFEILSREIPLASAIADSNIHALNRGQIINPPTLDDTYLCWMLHTYLQAYDNYHPRTYNNIVLPHAKPFITKYFPHAGYMVIKKGDYYMIIGASKGGVIRIYDCKDKSDLIFSDCGYSGTLSTGEKVSSQWLDYPNKVVFQENNDFVAISGTFHKINEMLFTPKKMIFSRIGLFAIRRIPFARKSVYQHLRKMMITGNITVPIEFTRRISYSAERIKISDVLDFKRDFTFKYFNIVDKFSPIYAQSTEFFQIQELSNINPLPEDNLAEFIRGKRKLSIVREIYPDSKELKYEIKVDNQKLTGDVK